MKTNKVLKIGILKMMVGVPGSGKGYFIRHHAEDTDIILSSDEYRQKLYGDINDQTHNSEVFQRLHFDMRKYLEEGKIVWYDATNVSAKNRRQALDIARSVGAYADAYVMCTPELVCINRDANRDRTFGEAVIHRMVTSFQMPVIEEGFNRISLVKTSNLPDIETEYPKIIEKFKGFSQNSKYHTEDLYEHSMEVANYVSKDSSFADYMTTFAALHDIGKLETRTQDENDASVSHFYRHENVGAYRLLTEYSYPKLSDNQLIEGIFLVNMHMKGHEWENGGNSDKFESIYGNNKYMEIKRFCEMDSLASHSEDEGPAHKTIEIYSKKDKGFIKSNNEIISAICYYWLYWMSMYTWGRTRHLNKIMKYINRYLIMTGTRYDIPDGNNDYRTHNFEFDSIAQCRKFIINMMKNCKEFQELNLTQEEYDAGIDVEGDRLPGSSEQRGCYYNFIDIIAYAQNVSLTIYRIWKFYDIIGEWTLDDSETWKKVFIEQTEENYRGEDLRKKK